MRVIDLVEILGTLSFAVSGSVSAMQKRLDVFGVLIIAFVTAIGGGTIRDLLIGALPVAWMTDLSTVITVLVAYFLALFFNGYLRYFKRTIFWLDTVGLAVFCMVAIQKSIGYGLHPILCVALGTITGCFGGVLRDVLLNEIPYVFRKDIYASACIAGGLMYFICLKLGVPYGWLGWLGGLVVVVIRTGATFRGWRLPLIYTGEKGTD